MKNTLRETYERPMVLSHQKIQFETAHSWNKGKGQLGAKDGNCGIHYKNPPYTGTRHGNGDTNGNGHNK